MTPEFSRIVRAHEIGGIARTERLTASEAERAALAMRFGLLTLGALDATLVLQRDAAGIHLTGQIAAAGEQACVVSAEAVAFALTEAVDLRFGHVDPADDELELGLPDLDMLTLDGDALDLGEVVAQSLGLALDPYPRAPAPVRAPVERFVISEAEAEARIAAEKARANPFNVLRGGQGG